MDASEALGRYVQRVLTDDAYAAEIRSTLANLTRGQGTAGALLEAMAVDEAELRALSPRRASGQSARAGDGEGNEADFSTTVTTATTATFTSPTTVTTATTTTLMFDSELTAE